MRSGRLESVDDDDEAALEGLHCELVQSWDEARPRAQIVVELLDPRDAGATDLSVAIHETDRIVQLATDAHASTNFDVVLEREAVERAILAVQSVIDLTSAMEAKIDRLPRLIVEARRSIRLTERALEDASEMGYIVDLGTTHADACRAHLFDAEASVTERRFVDGHGSALMAVEMAQQVALWAADLPARSDRIKRGIADATASLESFRAEIDGAATEVVSLADHHAENALGETAVYPGEAAAIANEAEDGLDIARAASHPDSQRWDEAEAALQDVSGILAEGRALITLVFSAREELADQRVLAEVAIQRAASLVDDAKHAAQSEADQAVVSRAFSLLVEAQSIAGGDVPDWPRALRAARAIEEVGDRILAAGRTNADANELEAARAATASGAVKVALSRLDGYVEAHRRRISSATLDRMSYAHDLVVAAESEGDAAKVLRLLVKAEAEALGGYRDARSDVERARRHNATAFSGVGPADGWFGPSRRDPFADLG